MLCYKERTWPVVWGSLKEEKRPYKAHIGLYLQILGLPFWLSQRGLKVTVGTIGIEAVYGTGSEFSLKGLWALGASGGTQPFTQRTGMWRIGLGYLQACP